MFRVAGVYAIAAWFVMPLVNVLMGALDPPGNHEMPEHIALMRARATGDTARTEAQSALPPAPDDLVPADRRGRLRVRLAIVTRRGRFTAR